MDKTLLNELCIKVCKYDDQNSFTRLFDGLYLKLYTFAFDIVGDKLQSEDIVADVFTWFWTNRKTLTITNALSYFYTATRNASLNQKKKKITQETISIEDLDIDALKYTYNPEIELISKEEVDKINEAIKALPERCRMILYLIRENRLKYKEVAQIMNISEKTVENQLAIAMKKITRSLDVDDQPRKKQVLYLFLLA